MHKIILMLLLAIVSSSALADWVRVGTTSGEELYANPASIRKAGNLARMWDMTNHKAKKSFEGRWYQSVRGLSEYDCQQGVSRVLAFSLHSLSFGKGEVIFNDASPHDWFPIPPGSVVDAMRQFACKGK